MPSKEAIFHARSMDAQVVSRTRNVIQETRDLLLPARPDTFLGRKTHEPFPNTRDREVDGETAPGTTRRHLTEPGV